MSALTLSPWNWLRVLRLAVGAAFLYEGWHSSSGFAYAAGGLFAMQAILNAGCPLMGSCAATPATTISESQDITYNEIK